MSKRERTEFHPSKLRTIEKLILSGKHPTLRALAMEARKPAPLSDIVRSYIAEYLEQASHSNGTRNAKRVFDRNSGDIALTSDEILIDNLNNPVVDAYHEYVSRRAEVKSYREIKKSGAEKLNAYPVKIIREAMQKACPKGNMIDQLNSDAASGWPSFGPLEIEDEIYEFVFQSDTDFSDIQNAARKSKADLIAGIAAEYAVSEEQLASFIDSGRNRMRNDLNACLPLGRQ